MGIRVKMLAKRSEAAAIIEDIDCRSFGENDPWDRRVAMKVMKPTTVMCLVAIMDGRTAGYAIYRLHKHLISLERIAVLPEFQRCGVASTLLRKVCRKLSGSRIRVQIVVSDEKLGVHLWLRSCGVRCSSVVHGTNNSGEDSYVFHWQRPAEVAEEVAA